MNWKKVSIYVLTTIALAAAGTQGDFEFLPVGMLMLSLAGAVIAVLVGLFTKKFTAAKRFGMLFVISLVAILADIKISEKELAKTEQTAGQVIAAIERYRSAHGALPPSLDRLVPEQFPKLPTARNGQRFMYEVESNDFRLGYSRPYLMVLTYDSKTKKWSTHD